jgi:hypothetical protein
VIAGLLVAASILGAVWEHHYLQDRYELAMPVSSDAPIGWRLDKRTGKVTLCELAPQQNPFALIQPDPGTPIRPVDRITVECGRY